MFVQNVFKTYSNKYKDVLKRYSNKVRAVLYTIYINNFSFSERFLTFLFP